MFVNIVSYNVFRPFFTISDQAQWTPFIEAGGGAIGDVLVTYQGAFLQFGIIALLVQLSVCILMLIIRLRGKKGKVQHAWAASAPVEDKQENVRIPLLAYFIPLIPVVLAIVINWEPVPSILLAILLALLLTGKFKSYRDGLGTMFKALRDGCAEVSMLIIIMISIVIFSRSAGMAAPMIGTLIAPIIPASVLGICILFAVFAPIGGLFRGPFVFLGMGAATVVILRDMNIANFVANGTLMFPWFVVFSLIYIPDMSMCFGGCPTHSAGAWAVSYAKLEPGKHILSTAPWGWMACAISLMVLAFMFG